MVPRRAHTRSVLGTGPWKGFLQCPAYVQISEPRTTLGAPTADLMHPSHHPCESHYYLHFINESRAPSPRSLPLRDVSGPSVYRAGDLPSTPHCHSGNRSRVLEKEGESGWGPGPRTWRAPGIYFSSILYFILFFLRFFFF